MDTLEERTRAAVENFKRSGSCHRFPDNVREVVLEFAHERRAQGTSLRAIALSIGLSESSLCRWVAGLTRAKRKGRMVPVEVVREPAVGTGVTSLVCVAGNYRIEGLDVVTAAELLGRLS